MDKPGLLTIDRFNKLMGQETLHPLISLVDLSDTNLRHDLRLTCDFYGLLYCPAAAGELPAGGRPLRFIHPGETVEIPSASHCVGCGYRGVLFHPDLLCDTPLEERLEKYDLECRLHRSLSEQEGRTVADCLQRISQELHHAIDRHSALIIASHIELMLNYLERFLS